WFALGTLPLAWIWPDWNAWRNVTPSLGLGAALTAALGAASPWLAGGLVVLRAAAVLAAPGAPQAAEIRVPQAITHVSWEPPGRGFLRPVRVPRRAGGLGARRCGGRRLAEPPELRLGRGEPRVLRDGGPARAGGRPPRPGRARGAVRASDQARLPGGGRAGSRAGGRGVAAVKAAPVDTAGADGEACGGHAKGGSVSRSRRLLAVSMTLRCPYCSTTTFLLTARFPWVRRSQKTPDGSPCPPERSTRCWPAPRNPTSRHATTRPP